ncbi:hypothetical protein NCCP133_36460 [Cytobacillus sp. NCCP-133]|nr:hypothetical protein NCCP133_36460 [Cytobacillus sp. NCCP-133]
MLDFLQHFGIAGSGFEDRGRFADDDEKLNRNGSIALLEPFFQLSTLLGCLFNRIGISFDFSLAIRLD